MEVGQPWRASMLQNWSPRSWRPCCRSGPSAAPVATGLTTRPRPPKDQPRVILRARESPAARHSTSTLSTLHPESVVGWNRRRQGQEGPGSVLLVVVKEDAIAVVAMLQAVSVIRRRLMGMRVLTRRIRWGCAHLAAVRAKCIAAIAVVPAESIFNEEITSQKYMNSR